MAGDAAAVNRTAFPPLLRLLVAGAAVVVIVMGLRAVSSVLTIFMVALVLAESLAPAMQWLMRRGLPAAWASILTVLVSLVSGVVLLGLLINSLTRLVQTLPGYGEKLQEAAASAEGLLTRMHVDTTHLTTGLLDPHKVLSAATEVGSHLIDTLGHAVFVLLLVAFMLIDFAVQEAPTPDWPGAFGGCLAPSRSAARSVRTCGSPRSWRSSGRWRTWPRCWCCGWTMP